MKILTFLLMNYDCLYEEGGTNMSTVEKYKSQLGV